MGRKSSSAMAAVPASSFASALKKSPAFMAVYFTVYCKYIRKCLESARIYKISFIQAWIVAVAVAIFSWLIFLLAEL